MQIWGGADWMRMISTPTYSSLPTLLPMMKVMKLTSIAIYLLTMESRVMKVMKMTSIRKPGLFGSWNQTAE